MDRYGSGGSIQISSKLHDLTPFGANPTVDALFDASQYEFFGGGMVEEVDFRGLEDEDDDLGSSGFEEEEFQLDKEEVEICRDLYLKLMVSQSHFHSRTKLPVGRQVQELVETEDPEKVSSSASELARNADVSNWFNQRAFDAEAIHESRKWSSHPYSSFACFMEPDSLHRTSSYPEQQPTQKQTKPLEQGPMLAARVIIEDVINLLLDSDDIDRFLQFNQLPDGGAQFRQRKHVLLEGLASSLELVDLLCYLLCKNGQSVNLAPKDDLVFPIKGRKLLLRPYHDAVD
ncbi:hypothetical protein OROHE_010539 [Orobanche hederae]